MSNNPNRQIWLRITTIALIIAALFTWGLHPQLLVPIGVALGAIVLMVWAIWCKIA